MKFNFILIVLLAFSISAYAQTKNTLAIVYGAEASTVNINGAIGDYGYGDKSGMTYGLSYTRSFTKHISFEASLLYVNDKTELHTIQPPRGDVNYEGDSQLISLPVYFKLAFLKYLFFQAGLSLDKQTNFSSDNSHLSDQSGIGRGLGVGVQFKLGRANIFVNPYIQEFSVIHFGAYSNNNLTDTGVKFGVGYNF